MKSNVSAEAIEARRAYQNEWRRKNKDRIKDYNARYWQRKAEELKQQSATEQE